MLAKKIKSNDENIFSKENKTHLNQRKVFSKPNSIHSNATSWSNFKYLIIPIHSHFHFYIYPSFLTHLFHNKFQTLDPTSSAFSKHFLNKLEGKSGVYVLVHNT